MTDSRCSQVENADSPRKRCDLAIELQEGFLSQILGLGRVCRHAQAERVHAPLMLIVKSLERLGVPLLGFFDGVGFVKVVSLSLP